MLLSVVAAMFPRSPGISFAEWFAFAFPLCVAQAAGIFALLLLLYARGRRLSFDTAQLAAEHAGLGPVSLAERVVAADLCLVVLLWATRSGFGRAVPGWKALFPYPPGDGTVAVLGALLLFAWDIVDWRGDLLRLQWDIIVLLGGGTAMALGCARSGFSGLVAEQLEHLGRIPLFWQVLAIAAIMTATTELISNIASANLVLPILGSLAARLRTNPFLFMLPATIASSYAFMFPISTPPNAIVFAYGFITIKEMALTGFLLNVLGILSLTLWTVVAGPYILGDVANWPYFS